ncbi:MAG TPA: hypothetical protein PK360_07960 [bacterium]|nr:hypothetical protein [bacterium]
MTSETYNGGGLYSVSRSYTYDKANNRTAKTEGGVTSTYNMYPGNRLQYVSRPGSSTQRFTYDSLGQLTAAWTGRRASQGRGGVLFRRAALGAHDFNHGHRSFPASHGSHFRRPAARILRKKTKSPHARVKSMPRVNYNIGSIFPGGMPTPRPGIAS